MNFAHLAAQLRVMRYRAGIDQRTLGDRSGVSSKMISAFETGVRTHTIKLATLDRLASAVGLTVSQVLAIEPTAEERILLHLRSNGAFLRIQREPVPFVRRREPVDPLRRWA